MLNEEVGYNIGVYSVYGSSLLLFAYLLAVHVTGLLLCSAANRVSFFYFTLQWTNDLRKCNTPGKQHHSKRRKKKKKSRIVVSVGQVITVISYRLE
jgi:cytochrome b561